jgi:hypothetical protein
LFEQAFRNIDHAGLLGSGGSIVQSGNLCNNPSRLKQQ